MSNRGREVSVCSITGLTGQVGSEGCATDRGDDGFISSDSASVEIVHHPVVVGSVFRSECRSCDGDVVCPLDRDAVNGAAPS